MIPVSTVTSAMAFLFSGITSAINDSEVLVSYGIPGPGQPDDIVYIGSVDRTATPYQMVGSGQAGWIDEQYDVEVVISSFRGGDDSRAVFERATSLADTVISVVRTDPSLGGVVQLAYPSDVSYVPAWDNDHKGYSTDVTLTIRCRARI